MKVFSKKKFFNSTACCEEYCRDEAVREWVDESDMKPVVNGRCNGQTVVDAWTEDVYNPVEDAAKKEQEDLWAWLNDFDWNHILKAEKKPAPKAVNCRCYVETGKPPKHPRYVIAIECTDDFTFAKMFVDDKLVKVTSAKCNPADKFSWRIGAQTAFNRLWKKKKKPVKPVNKYAQLFEEKLTEFAKEEAERIFRRFDRLPPVVREVKRRAKPGEWVKIVAGDAVSEDYKIGDVLQIVRKSGYETDVAYYKDGIGKLLWDWEYVVLEGYKPE